MVISAKKGSCSQSMNINPGSCYFTGNYGFKDKSNGLLMNKQFEILKVNGKDFTHIDYQYGPQLDMVNYDTTYIGYIKNGTWYSTQNMIKIDDKKITGIYKFCIQFVNGGQNVAEACLYNYNNTRPTLKLTLKYTRTGAQKEVTVTLDADMEGGTGGGGDVLQPAT